MTARRGRAGAEDISVNPPEAYLAVQGPGEWVPKACVWEDEGISPRRLDRETVERYREVFLELPPIVVVRDTFQLIDGRHRLRAAPGEWVRIVEVDVAPGRLAAEAFLANVAHGRPYTTAERVQGLKALWQADPGKGPSELARLTGLDRHTVARHLDRWAPKAADNRSSGESAMAQSAIRVTRERDEDARFSDEWEEPEEDTACPHGRSLERSCPECEEEEGDGVEEDEGVADAGGEVADRGAPAQAIGPVADAVQGAPERATEASPVGEVLRYGLLFEAATGDVAEQLANAMIMPISTGQRVEELAALVVPHAREMNFFRLCRGEILAFWPAFYEALDGLTE